MHDRTIDEQVYTFGNAGGLYLNAMTWWDHQTKSIWTQPVGEALQGKLSGTRLELLPSRVTTFADWVESHPQSFVMINDVHKLGDRRQGFSENFVIGVILQDEARAYYFSDVAEAGMVQDQLGDFPLVVWAEEPNFSAFLRELDGQVLNFQSLDGGWQDIETGSGWDLQRGLAISGELAGLSLQPVPTLTSFDWAWNDFYPFTGFYTP